LFLTAIAISSIHFLNAFDGVCPSLGRYFWMTVPRNFGVFTGNG
jgi:hypothetical protein